MQYSTGLGLGLRLCLGVGVRVGMGLRLGLVLWMGLELVRRLWLEKGFKNGMDGVVKIQTNSKVGGQTTT